MVKAMTVFGTRPEGIKMAPVVMELESRGEFEPVVALTAQHRQMLDQVMSLFSMRADYDLNIMKDRQTLHDITVRALEGLGRVLADSSPDVVLVQGDTTTAFAAALAAFYARIPVGHIEAGLRTDDMYNPFPEEMNRRLISSLASMHFAPTAEARRNLLACGVPADRIFLTGNTVVDALKFMASKSDAPLPEKFVAMHSPDRRALFVETHRRENLGEPMRRVCRALRRIVEADEGCEIVFSVHRNPLVREVVFGELEGLDRVILLDPVDYLVMIRLLRESFFVLTDSGGLQEEAPSLGKPVIVLRENTERPEGVRAGNAVLAGTDEDRVFGEAMELLKGGVRYAAMSQASNPYGDGRAASRIADAILFFKGLSDAPPDEFRG